jgi:hypothetical protein
MMDNGEFFDMLIPCFAEVVDKFGILLTKSLKESISKRLNRVLIKSVKELSQVN